MLFDVSPQVQAALNARRPIVALESTILTHGLPRPNNRSIADEIQEAVVQNGALPATIAVLDGVSKIGLSSAELDRICSDDPSSIQKLGLRDLAQAAVQGVSGGTTVASTAHLAAHCGIEVFATGGLGGVHRGYDESGDESGDLRALATAHIVVVCAGVKSILDVPTTLQRLETLNISICGYKTNEMPGFIVSKSGHYLGSRVDSATEAAQIHLASRALNIGSALVIAQPLNEMDQLDPALHDEVLAEALELGARLNSKDSTPAMLAHFHQATKGASLDANVKAVIANASLGAQIANEISRLSPSR